MRKMTCVNWVVQTTVVTKQKSENLKKIQKVYMYDNMVQIKMLMEISLYRGEELTKVTYA